MYPVKPPQPEMLQHYAAQQAADIQLQTNIHNHIDQLNQTQQPPPHPPLPPPAPPHPPHADPHLLHATHDNHSQQGYQQLAYHNQSHHLHHNQHNHHHHHHHAHHPIPQATIHQHQHQHQQHQLHNPHHHHQQQILNLESNRTSHHISPGLNTSLHQHHQLHQFQQHHHHSHHVHQTHSPLNSLHHQNNAYNNSNANDNPLSQTTHHLDQTHHHHHINQTLNNYQYLHVKQSTTTTTTPVQADNTNASNLNQPTSISNRNFQQTTPINGTPASSDTNTYNSPSMQAIDTTNKDINMSHRSYVHQQNYAHLGNDMHSQQRDSFRHMPYQHQHQQQHTTTTEQHDHHHNSSINYNHIGGSNTTSTVNVTDMSNQSNHTDQSCVSGERFTSTGSSGDKTPVSSFSRLEMRPMPLAHASHNAQLDSALSITSSGNSITPIVQQHYPNADSNTNNFSTDRIAHFNNQSNLMIDKRQMYGESFQVVNNSTNFRGQQKIPTPNLYSSRSSSNAATTALEKPAVGQSSPNNLHLQHQHHQFRRQSASVASNSSAATNLSKSPPVKSPTDSTNELTVKTDHIRADNFSPQICTDMGQTGEIKESDLSRLHKQCVVMLDEASQQNALSGTLLSASAKTTTTTTTRAHINQDISDTRIVNNYSNQTGTDSKQQSSDLSFANNKTSGTINPTTVNGNTSTGRSKRLRTSFKMKQLMAMKAWFEKNQNPDAKDLRSLAQATGLSKRVLQVWFQNARAKWRRNNAKTSGQIYEAGQHNQNSMQIQQQQQQQQQHNYNRRMDIQEHMNHHHHHVRATGLPQRTYEPMAVAAAAAAANVTLQHQNQASGLQAAASSSLRIPQAVKQEFSD